MELNQKKVVIFDLDGTLVDSMWIWKATDVEYLAKFDLEYPGDLQKETEGMSFLKIAAHFKKRFSLEDSLEQIKEAWVQMSIEKHKNEVPSEPGARAFLDYVSMNGIVAGIVTGNGRTMVDAALDSLDICRYFKVVTVVCEMAAGKPAPNIYLSAADRLHVRSSDCAVLEDAPVGVQAGRNAGMTVFAVGDAFSQDMRGEKRQLADYYIKDYYELLDGVAGRKMIIYL